MAPITVSTTSTTFFLFQETLGKLQHLDNIRDPRLPVERFLDPHRKTIEKNFVVFVREQCRDRDVMEHGAVQKYGAEHQIWRHRHLCRRNGRSTYVLQIGIPQTTGRENRQHVRCLEVGRRGKNKRKTDTSAFVGLSWGLMRRKTTLRDPPKLVASTGNKSKTFPT